MDSEIEPIEEPAWDDGSAAALLDDLLEGLEQAPEQAWNAFQGLEAIDSESRLRIVAALLEAPRGEGVTRLLDLLADDRDARVRETVRKARPGGGIEPVEGPASRRLLRSLVTAVDGEGAGAVVVSTARQGVVRASAFLCDVRKGVVDVLGVVEPDPAAEAELYDQFVELSAGRCVQDAPDLALGLLAGSLLVSGRETPPAARSWLDSTLGPGFHTGAFLSRKSEWASRVGPDVLADRSWMVLEECPAWVDRSALTFELAEEICLRERRAAADPARDAGAYRFLFEHRLIHRLELYRRMLLWMAFFWEAAGDDDLALSAGVLASQLGDEQYAVPSHPFAVALTTRSLHEAQRLLGTTADPRTA